MEFRDRLNAVITEKRMSSYKISKITGIAESTLSNYRNKETRPTDSNVRLLANCLGVSEIWLLTGMGEMLHNPATIEAFKEDIEEKDIVYAEGSDIINSGDFKGSLVYNIDGTCGPSNRDFNFVQECVIGSINLPGFDPKMPIVEAVEDSMIPRISPHDLVGLQEVLNWDVIFWGKPYFVITQDYRMFKILKKCKEDSESVILHSINESFDDIKIKKTDIFKLFIVKKVLSLRTEVM